METILLLGIVAVVIAVFVWLRRQLGDEWPPRPRDAAEAPAPLAGARLTPATPTMPLPEAEFALEAAVTTAAVLPASLAAVATPPEAQPASARASDPETPGVAAPPAPMPRTIESAPRPVTPLNLPTGAVLRRVTWALVGGGVPLLLLSQWVARILPPGGRVPAFLIFLFGGLALLVGIQSSIRGALGRWFGRWLAWLAALLRVTPVQAVLLLLALPYAWLARQAAGDGLLARQLPIAVFAWLAAIGLAVAGAWERRPSAAGGRSLPDTGRPAADNASSPARPRPEEAGEAGLGFTAATSDQRLRTSGPPQSSAYRRWVLDRWDILFSVVIFVVALGLRAWQMGQYPSTYSGDEGSAGLFAIELLTGKANNLFGVGWFSFPALYFTVQSAAIALFGQTVEAVRLTSAISGALTVVALYWLGRAMFDRTTALLAALYLAASHYHIHMSRIALNNVWDGLFGTLAIAGLWHGWKTGRRSSFILCGLALGLGQYFYVSIRPLPVLFLVWAGAAFLWQRPRFHDRFHGLILAALIALVVYLPLGLYFLEKPDEFQAPLNRVSIFGPWLEGELARGERTTAEIILDQAVNGALGFTHEPLRLLYNPGSPLLLAGAGTLFLLGILWALLNFDLRYLLLILPLLAVIASNAISQDSPASQRYILAMPLVTLFMAVPLGEAVAWLRAQYPRYRTAIVAAAFALLAIVAAVDLNYYFNRVYNEGYVLGGLNTQVATEIAYYLRDKEPAGEDVFFFGFPRMGYFSLSTIPFLAPDKQAQDVIDPLTAPSAFPVRGPTLFIFLPERLNELDYVRQQVPDGTYREFRAPNGELHFAVYKTS